MKQVSESARDIDVVAEYDVIVCGGGPAGIAAAIAAGRNGAKTCLIETHGCLGGIWTAGSLTVIHDGPNKRGLLDEILSELDKYDARKEYLADVETMKLVLEQMCAAAGVRIRLHTRVVAVMSDGGTALTHIVTESKSGREAWSAKIFIDTTGDGDVAARAGCSFELGEEGTGRMQPMSLIALVAGMDPEEVFPFTNRDKAVRQQTRLNMLEEIRRGGCEPSYHRPSLVHLRDTLYLMMANHEYGVSGIDANDVTRATIHARREIHEIVQALRSLSGPWKNMRLVATAAQIGVRESRRIRGRYTVTAENILNGITHEDGICRVAFGIDVHSLNAGTSKGPDSAYKAKYEGRHQSYDIPLRALIAADYDNMLMAGRCISGDFIAHSSYRVTGNAVQMGQAAGTLAAVSVARNQFPHEVPWAEVRKRLPGL